MAMLRRGARGAEMALVDGCLAAESSELGSDFDTLCRWLDLPRLVVVNVAALGNCQLPPRPAQADGLILDGICDRTDRLQWQTRLESLWGIPVLGGLEMLPQARAEIERLPAGAFPNPSLCHALGTSLLDHSRLERILQLSACRPLPPAPEWDTGEFELALARAPVVVAVAYDEAFHDYFPDTLELLEVLGVSIEYFSPLRDESLPFGTDIVYLGNGNPVLHAGVLADNQCMHMALRDHVRHGKRLYAEGGGLGFLSRLVRTADGRHLPMVGVLPAVVSFNDRAAPPRAVELSFSRPTWLGKSGQRVRGYLDLNWTYTQEPADGGCAAEDGHRCDLVSRDGALGSRLHLNFAVLPELMKGFCQVPEAALA